MKFKELFFSKSGFFSVGIEKESGEYYISIPVSNSLVDYEEYYKLDKAVFEENQADLELLKSVADECRKRLRDGDLFYPPGSDRGTPR